MTFLAMTIEENDPGKTNAGCLKKTTVGHPTHVHKLDVIRANAQ
jgi:hypothetical protein